MDCIYTNLQEKVREEVALENQGRKTEVIVEEKLPTLLTPLEQQALSQMEQLQNQPIIVSASLRDDLVAIQKLLEANGKNPELLEKVKKDIEFFDTEVVKHIVQ